MKYVTQTAMRNHSFRRAYRKARNERIRESVSRLVDDVLTSPVERGFFVSADHVLVMNRRRREGKLPKMTDLTATMWHEIFTALDDYMSQNPGCYITEAVCHVLANGKASRYFMSRNVAIRLALDSYNSSSPSEV